MICPVIHPEPCPDPEACATGWPCERVLALQDEVLIGKLYDLAVERYTQYCSYGVNKGQIELLSYGPTSHPLPAMEGQIAIVPTPDEE